MARRQALEGALILAGAMALFVLTFRAPVSAANSDPRYGLLVSLALIEHGTVRLDAYENTTTPPLSSPDGRQNLIASRGHLYYNFPLGTPLLATPAVAVARLVGYDLTNIDQQNQLQNGLAALSTAGIWLLLVALLRLLLPAATALPLALVIMVGSTLTSTLGTALWSHHGAVASALAALLLLVGWQSGRWARPGPLLGLLLFLSFLSRPSMALFVILVLALLAQRERRAFLETSLVAGLLFAAFLFFSRLEFATWVPPYYAPQRLTTFAATPIQTALSGLLLSPSRGLLVYSPWLLIVGGVALVGRRRLRDPWLVGGIILWGAALLLLNSRAVIWWGGHSFGPRLLTDWLPGLALLSAMVWRDVVAALPGRARAAAWLSLAALGAAAMVIHVGSGLYNIESQRWNGRLLPDVDANPEIVFDWRYPQFLATADMLCARNRAFVLSGAPPAALPVGAVVGALDPRVVYAGWAEPGSYDFRWLECRQGALLFNLGDARADGLVLALEPLGGSTLEVALNGQRLGSYDLPPAREPWVVTLPLPAGVLRPGPNEITLTVPEAGEPVTTPPYTRGLALLRWQLTPGD